MAKTRLKPLPNKEAIAFWKDKVRLGAGQFSRLTDEAKVRAFAVSGIAKGAELESVFMQLSKAISEGITFNDFKSSLSDVWDRRGWTGVRAWRIDNIFRTNIQTAFHVGRYRQMMRVTKNRPYWMYDAINDSRTRPTHRALDGKIYRYDSPFWERWYPPNGYRCFPPGTPVLTRDGWRDIALICVDDRVIGGSGENQRVTAVHQNFFNGYLRRLHIKNGLIDATPNHRILTMRGWVRAENIHKGDILVQTVEGPGINPAVGDVDHADTKRRHNCMPLPAQREAAVTFAFDRQVQIGQKHVEPPGADLRDHDMIVDHFVAHPGNMVDHYLFSPGGRGHAGGVSKHLSPDNSDVRGAILLPDFRPSCGSGFFEFFRSAAGTWIGFLCFSFSRMITGVFHLVAQRLHLACRFLAASLGTVQPLCLDGFGSFPGFNPEMPHHAHEGSGINRPSGAQLPVRQFLCNVAAGEGLTGGAPLDGFNSLDDFIAWAGSHAHLQKVIGCESIPYTGTVCNLSVDTDESYIVRGATVHNCRCGVTTLSDAEIKRDGLTVETEDITGTLIEPTTPDGTKMPARLLMPDPGFAHNPGKTVWGGIVDQAMKPGIWKDMANLRTPADFRRKALANVRPAEIPDFTGSTLLPAGKPDAFYENAFIEQYGRESVIRDGAGDPVILSLRAFMADKTAGTWKFSKQGHGEMIPLIGDMLKQPYEIWLVPQQAKDGRIRLARRYISLWKTTDKKRIAGLSVFEVSGGVWQGVTAFLPKNKSGGWDLKYVEKQRAGLLLYKK